MVYALRFQLHPLLPVTKEPLANLLYVARYLYQSFASGADQAMLEKHFSLDVAKAINIDPAAVLARIDEIRQLDSDLADLIAA